MGISYNQQILEYQWISYKQHILEYLTTSNDQNDWFFLPIIIDAA